MLYRKGRIKRQGAGLSFFFHAPSASLVIVPAESRDTPFIFKEATSDYQAVDIQGQITYRVTDAPRLATMLDFTADPGGLPLGDGIEKLPVRLTNLVQVLLREKLGSLPLRQALASAPDLVAFARERLKAAPTVTELGLEVIDFSILKISPTPEIAKALEASAREGLLKDADSAIYERRNFAVEQERRIKENELQTQIAIEEKNRRIREEQMNVEIAVQEKQKLVEEARMNARQSIAQREAEIQEQQMQASIAMERLRKNLVATENENALARARTRAEASQMELSVLAGLNPELTEALVAAQMDPARFIGRAIRDLSSNAERIGQLNISPDLLQSLLDRDKSET